MDELREWLFKPIFNRAVTADGADERLTSAGGVSLLGEADHCLDITEHLHARLIDPRRQELMRYELVGLLRNACMP